MAYYTQQKENKMNTRLVTIIIIVSSFFTGFLSGIIAGKESEKRANQQKSFLINQEIHKIG